MKPFLIGILMFGVLVGPLAGYGAADIMRVAADPTVVGQAGVTDGDTIRMAVATVTADGQIKQVSNIRIRFFGIDAPEKEQVCLDADNKEYLCGHDATLAMESMVRGKELTCVVRDIDRYERLVAVCSAVGIPDINAELVRRGLAVAYRKFSTDYVDEEETARAARRGLWAGAFDMPWDWRRAQ